VNQGSIRVLVGARSPAVRAGLRELLERAGFTVGGESSTEALADVATDDVDVLVAEIGGNRELFDALRGELADVPAVLLAERAGPFDPEAAPRAWLTPEVSASALAAAVRAVVAGLAVYAPELAPTGGASGLGGDSGGVVAAITEREHDVLELLAAGLPNKGIALRLGISEHTVKFHVGSLLSKLEAQSRTEAVAIAARQGLLTL